MAIFDDVDSVSLLITEILKLKNSVKCPICLEILNNPVEIGCDHIFCKECFTTFVDTTVDTPAHKLTCPICNKYIKRQRNIPCANFEIVSRFVKTITEKIESQSRFKKEDFNSKTLKSIKVSRANENKPPKGSNEIKKDAFDLLMDSSSNYIVKKDKHIKTYINKTRNKKDKDELYEKITNFEDNDCRLKIIEWLCDNHNKFDRTSQTQSTVNDDLHSLSSFHMPSISQDVELRKYMKKLRKSKSTRRTRSLDVKIRTSNFKLRSHSFSGENQHDEENIDIEEVESDIDPVMQDQVNILQILEENCLNSIDSQVHLQQRVNSTLEKPNRKRKCRRSTNPKKIPKGNATGWARLKQINKALTKSNKEPKKLCVNLSSLAKQENNHAVKDIGQAKISKCPVIILNRLSAEIQLPKETDGIEKSKSDNLSETPQITHSSVGNNPGVNRLTVRAEIHTSKKDKEPKSHNLSNAGPYLSNNMTSNGVHAVSTDNNTVNVISTRSTDLQNIDCKENKKASLVLNIPECDEFSDKTVENEEEHDYNLICTISPSNSKMQLKKQSGSIFSHENTAEDADDIFELPTQVINPDSSVDSIEKNLIAMFSSQNSDEEIRLQHSNEISKIDDVFTLLEQLDKSVSNLEEQNKKNINIDILKLSIDKLRLILSKGTSKENGDKGVLNSTTQTVDFDLKSIAIQTEECDSSGFKISSTADFKTLEQHTIGVQTESVVNDGQISVDSGSVSSRTSEVLVSNNDIISNLKENYHFTESFDNLNFDTQAILNKNKNGVDGSKSIKKKLNFNHDTEPRQTTVDTDSSIDENAVVEDEEEVISAENSDISLKLLERHNSDSKSGKPGSQTSNVLFSLSKGSSAINKHEPVKRFKRIRYFNEDCDSECGLRKKLKKGENPYVADNLSIEIDSQDSQDETETLQRRNTSMNYDEYLDRIMSKYLQQEKRSTHNTRKRSQIPKKTTSQEIIDKCNALIEDANNSPHDRCSNKKKFNDDYITNDIIDEFDLPFDEKHTTQPAEEHRNSRSKSKDNFSESMFCSDVRNIKESSANELPFSNMECIEREFTDEFEPTPAKTVTNQKHAGEVKVLQNLVLQKGENGDVTSELRYNLEEELQKLDEVAKRGDSSEEVFSDSDVEIVDTTPQKTQSVKNMSFMSQSLNKRKSANASNLSILIPPPEVSPDVVSSTDTLPYCDKIFAPPTAFQDVTFKNRATDNLNDIISTDQFDITLVPSNMIEAAEYDDLDLDVTLTNQINTVHEKALSIPSKRWSKKKLNKSYENLEMVSQMDVKFGNVNKSKMNRDSDKYSWPINSSKSINISPIKHHTRGLNPIDRALKSNFSPLEIITIKSQPKRMSTLYASTPKKQKTLLSYVDNEVSSSGRARRDLQKSYTDLAISPQRNKPCIASTRISKDQQNCIHALKDKNLATYSATFNSSVTHMIVLVDEKNCITDHTMKFVSAVAAGIWVLRFEWVLECLSKNEIVPEEPYEVLDVSGAAGPRIGRLSRLKGSLLKNFRIHVAPPCLALNKNDIENVIKMLGGEVVPAIEMLRENRGIRLIITEAKATQDFYMYETWLQKLEVAAVDIEWLSRSVGQYRIQSFKPYTLCSDDTLNDLGYPEELLIDVPTSPF